MIKPDVFFSTRSIKSVKWLQDSDWQKLLLDTPAVTSAAEGCLWCWSNIASQPLVPGRVKLLRVAVKSVVLF